MEATSWLSKTTLRIAMPFIDCFCIAESILTCLQNALVDVVMQFNRKGKRGGTNK